MTTEDAHRQLEQVRGALRSRYNGQVTEGELVEVVERVAQRYLTAPVLDYVGILTERAARNELDRRGQTAA